MGGGGRTVVGAFSIYNIDILLERLTFGDGFFFQILAHPVFKM